MLADTVSGEVIVTVTILLVTAVHVTVPAVVVSTRW